MRVGQLLVRLRDRLDEATANTYSDIELVRYLDEAVLDLFRLQAQHDESYHNCEHNIVAATDSRVLHTDVTLYDIPTWVHKITSVRVASATGSGREANIPARTMHNMYGSFWAYHGMTRIMVHGSKAGLDLTLECSKTPAPMNAGAIVTPPNLTHTTTSIHFDHGNLTEVKYEVSFEEDMYKNTLIEFTGIDSASHAIAGSITRVSASTTVYDSDGTFTSLTFDKAVASVPATFDTWEFHAEVPTSSSGYMIALAAHKAFIRKSNFEAIGALVPDLERERARFIEAVTPRQDQVLNFSGMSNEPVYDYDMDRDGRW